MSSLQPSPSTSPAPRSADLPPWPVWAGPAGIVLGLALGLFATFVVGIFGRVGGSSLSHPTPAVSLIADAAFDLSFVVAALYLARLAAPLRPADFGFRRPEVTVFGARLPSFAGGALAVVLAGVSYYVVTAIYAAAFNLHGSDKLPSELGVSHSTAALVGAAVFVCVIAPIAEEFFFRGFLFGALRKWRIGPNSSGTFETVVAAVITGILFGLAHTGSASSRYLIPLGLLGFALCLVRWWTRSLYPCIALHSINNSLALGINQEHWDVLAVVGLIVASVLVIALITAPLAARTPQAT
jgi:uncharacterized protein